MKIEKLDRVVVYVDDLDAAKKLYSETLGISFDDLPREGIEPMKVEPGPGAASVGERRERGAGGGGVSISREGRELIQALPAGEPPRVACVHFKVSDYEGAMAEMEQKGIPLMSDITLGRLREAIYRPAGPEAPMLGLVAYDQPYVMDSIKSKG